MRRTRRGTAACGLRGELDEDVFVGWPVDAKPFLRIDIFGAASLNLLRKIVKEVPDFREQREARRTGIHERLGDDAVGHAQQLMGHDDRNLDELVEMHQRRHPGE